MATRFGICTTDSYMTDSFVPDQRRLLKLNSFFEPYPAFSIRVRPGLMRGVELLTLRDPRSPSRQRFVVQVHPALLLRSAPEWIEGAILTEALSRSGAAGARVESSEPLSVELERYFRSQVPLAAHPPLAAPPRPRTTPGGRATAASGRLSPAQQELFADPDVTARPEIFERAAAPIEVHLFVGEETHADVIRSFSILPEQDALVALWRKTRREYFPDRDDIDSYRVVWSERDHTSTLASCNPVRRRVSVARAMKQPGALPHLEALLYHEMCHAVLGKPEVRDGRRIIHGSDFKLLERRHGGIAPLDKWIKEGGWRDAVRAERRATGKKSTAHRTPRRRNLSGWRRTLRTLFGRNVNRLIPDS